MMMVIKISSTRYYVGSEVGLDANSDIRSSQNREWVTLGVKRSVQNVKTFHENLDQESNVYLVS